MFEVGASFLLSDQLKFLDGVCLKSSLHKQQTNLCLHVLFHLQFSFNHLVRYRKRSLVFIYCFFNQEKSRETVFYFPTHLIILHTHRNTGKTNHISLLNHFFFAKLALVTLIFLRVELSQRNTWPNRNNIVK